MCENEEKREDGCCDTAQFIHGMTRLIFIVTAWFYRMRMCHIHNSDSGIYACLATKIIDLWSGMIGELYPFVGS